MIENVEVRISPEILLEHQDEILKRSCSIDREIRHVWKTDGLCSCVGSMLESQIPNCHHVNNFINKRLKEEIEKTKKIMLYLSLNIKTDFRSQFFHTL